MDQSTRPQRKVNLLEQGASFGNVYCHVGFLAFNGPSNHKRGSENSPQVKKRKTRNIYIRVNISGVRSGTRTTGIRLEKHEDFDHELMVIKNDPIGSARLQALRHEIIKVFNERLLSRRSLNANLILDIALGLATHDDEAHYVMGKTTTTGQVVRDRNIKPKAPTAVGAIKHYIGLKEQMLGNGLAERSYQRYRQHGDILMGFLTKTYGLHTYLDDLTPAVEYDLFTYLKGQKKYTHNYAVKIIQFFKSLLTYAQAHRWVDRNVLGAVRLTRHHKEVKTLTMNDLAALAARDFVEPTLNQVRDVFLFCCYTGLAYTDVESLAKEHLVEVDGLDCILKDRNKSGVQSFVPLFPEAVDLLNRYADHPLCRLKGVLLPVISNQKMNNALKVIGNIVGIHETLHTHLARKTFTMFSEERGFGLDHMAVMLGHTNATMTERHYYKRRRDPVIKVFKELYSEGAIKRLAS